MHTRAGVYVIIHNRFHGGIHHLWILVLLFRESPHGLGLWIGLLWVLPLTPPEKKNKNTHATTITPTPPTL